MWSAAEVSRFVWPGGGAIARSDGVAGCPLCYECVSDFSRRRAASVGCRRRVTTQRPRCAKGMKNGSCDRTKFESYASDDGR